MEDLGISFTRESSMRKIYQKLVVFYFARLVISLKSESCNGMKIHCREKSDDKSEQIY